MPDVTAKEEIKKMPPISAEHPTFEKTAQPDWKSIFSSDEIAYLLFADNDLRAGFMHDRNLQKKMVDGNKNRLYFFSPANNSYLQSFGWVKFFDHDQFFQISFNDRDDYEAFCGQFAQLPKLGGSKECRERYKMSENCYVCDMNFKDALNSYLVSVMKSDNLKTIPNSMQ